MEPELSLLFDPGCYAADANTIPNQQEVTSWVSQAISCQQENAQQPNAQQPNTQPQLAYEVSVIFMPPQDIQALNKQYREKDSPTNVLSFPSELPALTMSESSQGLEGLQGAQLGLLVLGDIILCPEIVLSEAQAQQKKPLDHWAHMLIHGTFHLFGMDHQEEIEANTMESLEIQLLSELGIGNPYEAASGIHQ